MDDATPEGSKPKGIKPAKLTAIIVAAVVVALAGIGGGYAYWTHHEGNAYHEAVAQAENADKALMKAVDEATATEYKADQLKEPKLLDKLNDAIKQAKALKGVPEDQPGEWLAWRLASAKKANATDADEANAQAKALNAALKAVRDSKLAKELDGAKSQLKRGIDGASQTLKDTDGKVADNATRDSLKKAIDEANNTLSKKGVTDPKTYTDAKAKLDAGQAGDRFEGREGAGRRRGRSPSPSAGSSPSAGRAGSRAAAKLLLPVLQPLRRLRQRVFLQPWVFRPAAVLHALQQRRRFLRWFQPCRSDWCRFRLQRRTKHVWKHLRSYRTLASFLLSSSPCLTPPLH